MLIMPGDTIKFDNTQLLGKMGLTKWNEVKLIDIEERCQIRLKESESILFLSKRGRSYLSNPLQL